VNLTMRRPWVQRQSWRPYFARQCQPFGPLEGLASWSIQDWIVRRAREQDTRLTLVMIT
jgi:hypothetical protein